MKRSSQLFNCYLPSFHPLPSLLHLSRLQSVSRSAPSSRNDDFSWSVCVLVYSRRFFLWSLLRNSDTRSIRTSGKYSISVAFEKEQLVGANLSVTANSALNLCKQIRVNTWSILWTIYFVQNEMFYKVKVFKRPDKKIERLSGRTVELRRLKIQTSIHKYGNL